MTSEVLVEFKNVSFSYGYQLSLRNLFQPKQMVLKDVSFKIFKGDVVGVVGRNGAGKSTTLSLLAGILDPDSGEVIKAYENAALLNFNSGMIQTLSGRQNIYLQGLFLGMLKNEIDKIVDDIIDLSGLGGAINKPVKSYSTGMKARLGFAIAYYRDPELILIDETLGVGDRDFREKYNELMKSKIKKNQGATVIVSHSKSTILELCNRCVVVEGGTVVYSGPTEQALEKYEV